MARTESIMECFGTIYTSGNDQCRNCNDFFRCERFSHVLKKKEHYREKEKIQLEEQLFNIRRRNWGYSQ